MKNNSGFTLAEILIVVTLLVILGLGLLITLNPFGQILKGYDARRRDDLNKIRIAFENYYADHECYPDKSVLSQCNSETALAPYLKPIPCDPNDGKPYTIYLVPSNSTCPQQFAVYASLYSPFDKLANQIPGCPQTMAVTSGNMNSSDLQGGCKNGGKACGTYYGCKNGLCTTVSNGGFPSCGPNYCDNDCGGVNCARVFNGNLINECVEL